MDNSMEFTGKTIEDAISGACAQLNMERDDFSVEILEKPKSGFLGLRGTPAKIKVTFSVSKTDKVETFLNKMLEKMGSAATAHADQTEDGSIEVKLEGENLGALIGYRGETLDAIQHICGYVVNFGDEDRIRVTVDAENYRQKRKESLERLAQKIAAKVVKSRKNVTFEPMNAYERHVIHDTLQQWRDVNTYSVGVEPNRRVVVAYSRGGVKRMEKAEK